MDKNRRILIVDDQEDLREQLAKLLVQSGKKNHTATLVSSMRARLMGIEAVTVAAAEENDSPTYDIDTTGRGEEAFEMVRAALENHAPYAAMFIDMRMPPGWDGLKTTQKIREIDKNIEIVIITAYADHSQEEIAATVGCPDKLLYIKKPFQPEEIFQMALALTSKWNSDERERRQKQWLEKLVRSIRKVKLCTDVKNLHFGVLDALCSYTETNKGAFATWDESAKTWKVEESRDLTQTELDELIKQYSRQLRDCNTIQKISTWYFIPVKSESTDAVVVLSEVKNHNDTEWHKLLNILLMTINEVCESVSSQQNLTESSLKLEKLQQIAIQLKQSAELLSAKYNDIPEFKQFVEKSDEIVKLLKKQG
jgi:CheY-like chemotaxis protein